MKKIIFTACLGLTLIFASHKSFAGPILSMDIGRKFDTKEMSLGIEVGGTQVINDCVPLIIGITGIFVDNSLPAQNLGTLQNIDKNYTNRKMGNENGVIIKSGYTHKNMTFLIGAGIATQDYLSTKSNEITGWNDENVKTKTYLQTYAGILYHSNRLGLSAGYDNRRGAVMGVGGFF